MNYFLSKARIFFAFIALFISLQVNAQWTTLNTGVSHDLLCVDYGSTGYVWIGTLNNGILHSVNYGTSLNFVNGIDATAFNTQIYGSFDDIHATSATDAVSTGLFNLSNDLIIYGTNNSGTTWTQNFYTNGGALPRYLNAFDFSPGGQAVAVGSSGRIYYSNNNGSTWTAGTSGTTNVFMDVAWVSGSTFVAITDAAIYRSVNGGQTWTVIISGLNSLEKVSFAGGTGTGYAGGYTDLKKTTDGGLTWNDLTMVPGNISAITCIHPDTLYLATDQDLFRSYSGGQYWDAYHLANYQKIHDICFYDDDNGIAVGDNGYAWKTTNGGGVTYPVAVFNPGVGSYCNGGTVTCVNNSDPSYTFQWFVNGVLQSTQYAPTLNLTSAGNVEIQLVADNGIHTDTATTNINVNPIPSVQPFTVIRDSICLTNQGSFTIPNSQLYVSYALFDGQNQVGSTLGGNGSSITLLTQVNQTIVKPYRIRAIAANVCGADTLEVIDSLWLATPGPNVTAMLYRDTICTGDTTYMQIFNSEIGWEYYCSNAIFTRVAGNGGKIEIPVNSVTSGITLTVYAYFVAAGCVRQLPGTFPLHYTSTSASIVPGTLMGATNQPIAMSCTSSGFNNWTWDFGAAGNPTTSTGSVPTPVTYSVQHIDTVVLTARLDNTCERILRKPIYVYNTPLSSNLDTCVVDTGSAGLYQATKIRMDDYNNFYVVGYNVQSTNFSFIPYVSKFDSTGKRLFYYPYISLGNAPGAQGLPTGITGDRLGNTYLSSHFVANAYYDIQGKFIRSQNALIKLNPAGTFEWAIESTNAEFTDLITIDNHIYAIGRNVWNGCSLQTPKGGFTYTPSLNNKGEAFVMEIDPAGKVLNFDAFGSKGNGGISSPLKFNANYPLVNQFFDYDTLRQNLMAKKAMNGDLLICGMIASPAGGQLTKFGGATLVNNLSGGLANQSGIFVSRYNTQQGFISATNLLNGFPVFITSFCEDANGNYVVIGRAKNNLFGTTQNINFPVQNYEYQFMASVNPGGNLNWMMYADSMSFKAVGANANGTISLTANMTSKFLITDASGKPYNLSPTPSSGVFMLNFNSAGELINGDKLNPFTAVVSEQDNCGNYHNICTTTGTQNFKPLIATYSLNGTCSPNCYPGYNPNALDASVISCYLNDTTAGGPVQRDLNMKIRSHAIAAITDMQIRYQINNDPIQNYAWTGTLNTGDTASILLSSYTFNRSYNRINVWIQTVNNSVDDYQDNDTARISQVICIAPFNGTYSLGCDTCYFDSFQSSATTLTRCGVSGPVSIEVQPGNYFEQMVIDSIPFSSTVNTITWTAANGNKESVVLDFAAANSNYLRNTLRSIRGHNCILDKLTFKNTAAETYDPMQNDNGGRATLYIEKTNDFSIRNCSVYSPIRNTGGGSDVMAIKGITSIRNFEISDNYIYGGNYGVSLYYSLIGSNISILRNTIDQNLGIYINASNVINIDGNKIKYLNPKQFIASSISLLNCDSFAITNNIVSAEGWGGGFDINCDCQVASPCLIANNIVGSTPIWLPTATASFACDNVDIINNSFGNGVNLDYCNNIRFINNLVRSNGSFAITTNDWQGIAQMNNNRFQSYGVPITFHENSTDYDLSGWRTLTGFDLQSDSVTAEYLTQTDLHLRNSVSMPGIPWSGITTDIDGEIRSVTTPTIGADEFSATPLLAAVWPGDCDSSKLVDNFDILQIGLNFNKYQTSRPDLTTNWLSHPSLLWNQVQGNGANLNHVDCNGDGWINEDDTVVIVSNYGLSHAIASPDPQRPLTGPDLNIVPVGTVFYAGDTVHLKVIAGNALTLVDNLSGIGFQVPVPPSLIVPGSFKATIVNNWLCPDSNCIQYTNLNEATGVAAVSLVRLDGDGATAFGELADIQFIVNAAYAGNPTVTINMNDYQSYDPQSVAIPLTPNNGTITILNTSIQEVNGFNGINLYPNPAHSSATLLFNWKGNQNEDVSVRIYDMTGRMVQNQKIIHPHYGVNEEKINLENLKAGVYLLSLKSSKESKIIRVIIY